MGLGCIGMDSPLVGAGGRRGTYLVQRLLSIAISQIPISMDPSRSLTIHKETRLNHANNLIPSLLRLVPERFKQPTEHVKVRRGFGIDEPFWPFDGFGSELRCGVPPLERLGEGHPGASGWLR